MAESSIFPKDYNSDQSPDTAETYCGESSSSFRESASSAATGILSEGEEREPEEPLTDFADTRGLANSYADALTELIRTEVPPETDLALITEIGSRCVALMEESLEAYCESDPEGFVRLRDEYSFWSIQLSTVVRVEFSSIDENAVTDRAHVSMRATAVREDEMPLFSRDEEEVGVYDAARFPDVGGLWLGWPVSFPWGQAS